MADFWQEDGRALGLKCAMIVVSNKLKSSRTTVPYVPPDSNSGLSFVEIPCIIGIKNSGGI